MKHRSIGVFIMVLAALAAMPQASDEFQSLKSAFGECVRSEILNALASLQSHERGREISPRRPAQANPSAPESAKIAPQTPRSGKRINAGNDASAQESPSARVADGRGLEIARMIIDPSQSIPPAMARFDSTEGARFSDVVYHVAPQILQEKSEELRELAMIIPPDVEDDVPSLTSARQGIELKREASALKSAEMQREAAIASARSNKAEAKIKDEKIRRQLEAIFRMDSRLRNLGEENLLKLLKVRHVKQSAPTPASRPSCLTRQVALVNVEVLSPLAANASAGE
ncbi:MAG TPA: hypothetical protein VM934_00675 [Pyrinomonadaceae bacterium]|nr:hypothetical protein [Pyrinomonadaceae bacterium]